MFIRRETYVNLKIEIATLKAQVAALTEAVAHCRVLMTGLEDAVMAERARATTAIDRMLQTKGLLPVTPERPFAERLDELSGMFEETPEEVEAVRKAIVDQGIVEVLLSEAK